MTEHHIEFEELSDREIVRVTCSCGFERYYTRLLLNQARIDLIHFDHTEFSGG